MRREALFFESWQRNLGPNQDADSLSIFKKLPEPFESRFLSSFGYLTDLFYQPDAVDRAELIENDCSFVVKKVDLDPCWILGSDGREWGDDHVLNIVIHLVWRNDDAWPRILGVFRRLVVQIDEINVKSIYHCHSFFSNAVGEAWSMISSSSFSAIDLNASSQPERGF